MTETIAPLSTEELCRLLDATRKRYNLSSDEKLANLIGVSGQAIYRWRRGQVDRSARIIAALVRQQAPTCAETAS